MNILSKLYNGKIEKAENSDFEYHHVNGLFCKKQQREIDRMAYMNKEDEGFGSTPIEDEKVKDSVMNFLNEIKELNKLAEKDYLGKKRKENEGQSYDYEQRQEQLKIITGEIADNNANKII